MTDQSLDEIDRQILHLLQEDARNNSNATISDRIGVSPSTIGNRINSLEANRVIKGYYPDIDYDHANYPLQVLFICTTSITERSDFIQEIIEIQGVVNVKELMTGEENIHVEVVGGSNEDITHAATAIDDLGVRINEEILVKNEYPQPASIFE